ncbi:oxidoreductase domain protein [Thermobaculum terrenum ATCC BAA-798]|uniref:Oxidoreductase domain protein n=1 Tax=Thermobaculum terrenum (strain ATCC BAA-798 / CCMEE 7001 / YNP1) TaxID=525904 RepID=D1CGE0_THET1|nr:Gfo/Idh/MocA family oxidoreductase [Thermobaculum terrenum]ACZ42811.1 oxidoreductase domain protein [Thermobaculum terrenum ATCC BAA-798]
MYRVGIIGVGRGGEGIGAHSIGYAHAMAYSNDPRCQIVAATDISIENLNRFTEQFGVTSSFTDYREMLLEAHLDIVSISTYVVFHREMVEACAEAGVKGVWCEKPFALTMDDARAMVEACERAGTRLVVNHQRRYLDVFQRAKQLLRSGRVGQPVMFMASLPGADLIEWGTHWLDMFRFFADDQPARWVMGQVRCTGEKKAYGHLLAESALAYVCFEDGTRALLEDGEMLNGGFTMRLLGTEGWIDILGEGQLQVLDGNGVETIETRSNVHSPKPGHEMDEPFGKVLDALIGWIEGGPEPLVSGRQGMLSTELYLAAYESAWRRDKVDLPLREQHSFPLDLIAGEGR